MNNIVSIKLRLFAQVYMFFPLIAVLLTISIFDIQLSELGLEIRASQ